MADYTIGLVVNSATSTAVPLSNPTIQWNPNEDNLNITGYATHPYGNVTVSGGGGGGDPRPASGILYPRGAFRLD